MKKVPVFVVLIISLIFIPKSPVFAYQKTLGLTDKEIVERLIKLEEGQKALQKEMNIRFTDINKRFDDVNRRFDDINRRLDDINNRINKLANILIGAMSIFTILIATIIGLIFWDRKTTIDAAVRKVETDSRLIKALQELSKEDAKVAKVLRMFGLL